MDEIRSVKPNLFIIGASKCATTTVHDVLDKHPSIFMSKTKELNYFSWLDYNKRVHWYLSNFEEADENLAYFGESSPIYALNDKFPEIPHRIKSFNSDSKIIYIVRNPLERLKSVWVQTLFSGHWHQDVFLNNFKKSNSLMSLNLEKAIFDYPSFIPECKYASNFKAFTDEFGQKQTLLLFYENLKADPTKFYNSIFDFLELDHLEDKKIFENKLNLGAGKRMVRPSYINLPEQSQTLIRRALPPVLYKFVKTKSVPKPCFSQELKNKILNELSTEITQILKLGGKPKDFWKFD